MKRTLLLLSVCVATLLLAGSTRAHSGLTVRYGMVSSSAPVVLSNTDHALRGIAGQPLVSTSEGEVILQSGYPQLQPPAGEGHFIYLPLVTRL